MYIYGASGQGRVIIDMIDSAETIHGVFDDDPLKTEILNYAVSAFPGTSFRYDHPFFIAIGEKSVRKKIAEKLEGKATFGTIIHRTAMVSKRCEIDEGSVVMEGAIVKVNSRIGKQVIINTGASVDHDCIIGDFVHLAPQATLCGDIIIGEGTVIGAGATVIPGIRIGAWCKIAAGSVLTKHVADGATWIGAALKLENAINPVLRLEV